jgi:hypothetical protein
VNPSNTEGWVQSYTISVFKGYSCTGVWSVDGFLYNVAGQTAQVPTFEVFALTTGVATHSVSWPQVIVGTMTAGQQVHVVR